MIATEEVIEKIKIMGHEEMCKLWRFAPSNHPYFNSTLPYYEIFRNRLFDHFGGFSPQISKALDNQNIKD